MNNILKTCLILSTLGLNACGQGPQGEQGLPGLNGVDGVAGTGCLVEAIETSVEAPNGGARVICGDTTVLILNGVDGVDGSDGQDGTTTVIHCTVNKKKECI